MTGSKLATRNSEYLHGVMKAVGLEEKRLQMHYCSAAEGQKFQRTMIDMARDITELGPSPLRKLASAKKKKSSKK